MKARIAALIIAMLLAGCAGEKGIVDKGSYKIDTRRQAQAAWPRVKVLVIHYTADDFHGSLATLTDKNVSSHYLIPDINDTSIGIELENQGYRRLGEVKQFYPFNAPQIDVLEKLAKEIIGRYHIAPQNVVAHGDIAPQRKVDPGPLFPWQQLAQKGIGAWPDAARVAFYLNGRDPFEAVDSASLLDLLSRYGYQVNAGMSEAEQRRVISAFQMHFRPALYNGVADAQSQAIAEALLEKYGQG